MRALPLLILLAGCASAPRTTAEPVHRPDLGVRCSFVSSPVTCWKPAYRRLVTALPARTA